MTFLLVKGHAIMKKIWLSLFVATLSVSGTGLALAQAPAKITAESGVAKALEVQYQAALIRERRLADDQEQRLLEQHQATLRTMRIRFDQGIAGANAELVRAREQFAALVSRIAERDASVRIELDAYRIEAQRLARTASPVLLDAYQRFADGDRVGAWPAIESLTQASVRARMAAAGAASAALVRDAAKSRDIMRINGEATIAQVVVLWRQAADLDPQDFETQLQLAQIERVHLNNLPAATQFNAKAAQLIRTDDQKRQHAEESAEIAISTGDIASATTAYASALAASRVVARALPVYTSETLRYLFLLARYSNADDGYTYMTEALQTAEKLAAAEPNSLERKFDLRSAYLRFGDLYFEDSADEFNAHAFAITQELATAEPGNERWQKALAEDSLRVGEFNQALAIARQLSRSQPNNVSRQIFVANVIDELAFQKTRSDPAGATIALKEGIAVLKKLRQGDASDASLQKGLAGLLFNLGDLEHYHKQGDFGLANISASLALYQDLSERNPSDQRLRGYVGDAAWMLGLVHAAKNDAQSAERSLRQSIQISQKIADKDKQNEKELNVLVTRMIILARELDTPETWSNTFAHFDAMANGGYQFSDWDKSIISQIRKAYTGPSPTKRFEWFLVEMKYSQLRMREL